VGIKNWNAGIIRPVPVAPTGPYATSAAPGVWTLDQQAYWQKQGLWPTAGSVDPSAFIENLFSTYLYTGNGTTQTITNNIDLAGKGGLVWTKSRSATNESNIFIDTSRGVRNYLTSNTTNAQIAGSSDFFLTQFNSNGYVYSQGDGNQSGFTYASWTFRKQPKFFDIVTYTGDGTFGRYITHPLGSQPGFVVVKPVSGSGDWKATVNPGDYHLLLNSTTTHNSAAALSGGYINNVSSTDFKLNDQASSVSAVNASGVTYVAYLFANNAGGFGLTGTDNVISCGTYNGNSTTNSINLGYEPQWLLIKRTTVAVSDWVLLDNMRGLTVGTSDAALCPNNSNAEGATVSVSNAIRPTATGFDLLNSNSALNVSGSSYIYIAIRRGPMKTPTSGTSVFAPIVHTGTGSTTTVSGVNFPSDFVLARRRDLAGADFIAQSRLQGGGVRLKTTDTDVETLDTGSAITGFDSMTGLIVSGGAPLNTSGQSIIFEAFRRAPGFFDAVCYTGTGANTTQTHNLNVAPELWIIKGRSGSTAWQVGSTSLANTEYVVLNTTAAKATGATRWNSTYPTSLVFSLGTATEVNTSAATYVAYLFATVAGVSKVGSYTGTAALQTVACGFTTGARFVLIKRTNAAGNWYVWDSARGISSGTDPYLLLNSTAAEATGDNYVDTDTTGFKVTAAAPGGLNSAGGTYIFLAIA